VPFENTCWPLKPLGSVCATSEMIDPARNPTLKFKYVDIAAISSATLSITGHKVYSGPNAPSRARKLIRTGDVLVATTRPYLRSIAMVPAEYDQEVCSTGLCVLRPTEKVTSEWLFTCVQSADFTQQLVAQMRGAAYPAVTDSAVMASVIPVPPVDAQRHILTRVKPALHRSAEIAQTQANVLEESESLFQAAINSVVENEWPRVPLGELSEDMRNGWSGKPTANGFAVGVLRLSSVHGMEIDTSDVKPTNLPRKAIDEFSLHAGDVFIVRGNGSKHLVGRSAIARSNSPAVIFNDLLIRARLKECALPDFINYMIHAAEVRSQIETLSRTAAGIWKINQKNLAKVQVPCPPITTQKAVLDLLSATRRGTESIIKSIREIDGALLEQAILRKAFAGEF